MLARLALFVVIALCGLTGMTSAAQACACHHHVVRPVHRPACHCAVRHRASLRHVRRAHVVVQTAQVERHEEFSDTRAYRYAEADEHRWRSEAYEHGWGRIPSPPHPWTTDSYGFLTWSGKPPVYAEPNEDAVLDCPSRCGPPPRDRP